MVLVMTTTAKASTYRPNVLLASEELVVTKDCRALHARCLGQLL